MPHLLTYCTSGLAAGPYQLTPTYNGDTTYSASASATAALTVTPAATTTSMTLSAASAPYGHESVIRVSVATASQYNDVVTGPADIQAGTQTVCWLNLTAGHASCLLPDTALPGETMTDAIRRDMAGASAEAAVD